MQERSQTHIRLCQRPLSKPAIRWTDIAVCGRIEIYELRFSPRQNHGALRHCFSRRACHGIFLLRAGRPRPFGREGKERPLDFPHGRFQRLYGAGNPHRENRGSAPDPGAKRPPCGAASCSERRSGTCRGAAYRNDKNQQNYRKKRHSPQTARLKASCHSPSS